MAFLASYTFAGETQLRSYLGMAFGGKGGQEGLDKRAEAGIIIFCHPSSNTIPFSVCIGICVSIAHPLLRVWSNVSWHGGNGLP